jgi:predicted Rossmann fold nucleotide-binding protein DprA/Smf involved in DNA uptake
VPHIFDNIDQQLLRTENRMIHEYEISEIKSPTGLERYFDNKPPKIWCLGDPAILNRRLLGIISARQIDSDLALKSSQLIHEVASLKEVSFVSGWHSPLEEEALRLLLTHGALIVSCVSKSLHRFIPPAELESRIRTGEGLLLTHCSPKAKRISRDASIRRNQLVMGLAAALLVLSAPARSASLTIAKSALHYGKPVLTPEHRMNKELLGYDALPATLDNIRAALG